MRLTTLAKVKGLAGINNIEDELRIFKGEHVAMTLASDNVDVTDDNMMKRRPGFELLSAGTRMHSLWSDETTALVVEDGNLCLVNADFTRTILCSAIAQWARMSYCKVPNGDIFFTNNNVIGYVRNGGSYALPTVPAERQFRGQTQAGNFIEYFDARLWVARGNVLYFSDTLAPESLDLRKGFFQFDKDITLLRAVDDGIFVADGKTWFLAGKNPYKDYQRKLCADYDAIAFTDVAVDTQHIKRPQSTTAGESYQGTAAIWTSEKGICYGFNGGKFKNPTLNNYSLPSTYRMGTAAFMIHNNAHKYVSLLMK